jgi:hypothetical protein
MRGGRRFGAIRQHHIRKFGWLRRDALHERRDLPLRDDPSAIARLENRGGETVDNMP